MTAATGLSPSQALVLRQIGAHNGITPGSVATTLRFGQATITNIVDKLVDAGFVTRTRSDNDKRQILVKATPEGVSRLADLPLPLQAHFTRGFGEMARWEQAMMLAMLEKLGDLISVDNQA